MIAADERRDLQPGLWTHPRKDRRAIAKLALYEFRRTLDRAQAPAPIVRFDEPQERKVLAGS